MNILIVGGGAREHAIARALKRSPQHPTLFCVAPTDNPGISCLTQEYGVKMMGESSVIQKIAQQWKIDLAIIGPEAPLAAGVADGLWAIGIPVVGPTKKLAQIESSKAFTRDLLTKYGIPGSPRYRVFSSLEGVEDFLNQLGDHYVIKADGLMSGKGVKVAGDHLHSNYDALQFCEALIKLKTPFVIEEKLYGQEFSLLAFCDGDHLISMPLIQDHKRAYDNDEGPNTGGMGSYSDCNHSLPFLTEGERQAAIDMNEKVLKALMNECQEKYMGILYGSFIATKEGVRLIEYNARFGDPEAINALAILESDFVAICEAMVKGTLAKTPVIFSKKATVCKYAVPLGYPDLPLKNERIDLSRLLYPENLYYANLSVQPDKVYTLSGRTLAVLGIDDTLVLAEKKAEEEMNRIQGKLFHRKDIGTQGLIMQRIKQMEELRR